MSFLFFVAGVQLLPLIPTTKYVHIALLILCIWINYLYAPIVSSYRPIPDGIKVKKAKRQAFLFITVYAFLLFIIPENPYLTVGSWIIILQSLQLFVANLLQRRKKRETIQ
jgi:accessory gene regulator protein AgrB